MTNDTNQDNTALATRELPDAPIAFGAREELAALTNRMKVMLPAARLSKWQMEQASDKRAEAEQNLHDALWKAAQVCVFYRLIPGEDVHIIPFGNNFAVDLGIESWKKAADRYCQQQHITYHIHTTEMDAEDVRTRRGDDYDKGDVGIVAYLWRSDKAPVYEIFGPEKAMTKGYGIWRVKAKWDNYKKEWQADPIQAHRTPVDVAERRAMKMALKKEFSLDSLLAATPQELQDNQNALAHRIETEEKSQSLIQRPQRVQVEDDEDMLFAAPDTPPREHTDIEDGVYALADELPDTLDDFGEPLDYSNPDPATSSNDVAHFRKKVLQKMIDENEHSPVFDETGDDNPFADDTDEPQADRTFYADIAASLDGTCLKLAKYAVRLHSEGHGGAARTAQHNWLAGEIDKIVGQDGHRDVLGVLIQRPVTGDNPEAKALASYLLDILVEEFAVKDANGQSIKGDDGKVIKEPNPKYNADAVACIRSIHERVMEARGQLKLVEEEPA